MNVLGRPDGLGLRVHRHDRLQLEIKSELLSADPTAGRQAWAVDAWFVLPFAASVNRQHYPRETFYRDYQARLRLKTPAVGLGELCGGGVNSPLAVLELLAARPTGAPLDEAAKAAVLREPRLLCTMFRSDLRDYRAAGGSAEELAPMLVSLQQRWRAVLPALRDRPLGARQRHALSFCDEWLSMLLQQGALEQVAATPDAPAPVLEALRTLAADEDAYRDGAGWATSLRPDEASSSYVEQARLLKRYAARVLGLELQPNRRHAIARQGALAAAAALAMLWSVVAQLGMLFAWGLQPKTGVSISFLSAFTALAVTAYVLKDRIKSLAGPMLSARLASRLFDRRYDVSLADGGAPFGGVGERMDYLATADLPEEATAMRQQTDRARLLIEGERDVLHFSRVVEVQPRRAVAAFPRFVGVTDVLRINVWRWVRTFARSQKAVFALAEDGRARRVKLRNEYVVDAFVQVRRLGAEPASRLQFVRLILGRRGLLEVRFIDER